jgi:all-trans-retinol 13,14-reductase
MKYDFIIIGGGMSGLVCAYILSKEGKKVIVLEKNSQLGGGLQIFSRDKTLFETGVHYVGGLEEGQSLNQLFKYLGLMDKIQIKQMDKEGFDKIHFDNEEKYYSLGQGYKTFIKNLIVDFPHQEKEIKEYCKKIQDVCNEFPLYNLEDQTTYPVSTDKMEGVAEVIEKIISDKRLQDVLAAQNILYAGKKDITPFYVHALIVNSYIESAWRFVNGSSQVARILARSIKSMGGRVLKNTEVVDATIINKKVSSIKLEDGTLLETENIISSLHPLETIRIFGEDNFKRIYKNRINKIKNSISSFGVNICFKKDTFPYLNHNIYHFEGGGVWDAEVYTKENWPKGLFLCFHPLKNNSKFADGCSVLTYMHYDDVKKWQKTFSTHFKNNNREENYEVFKKEYEEKVIISLEKMYPNIRSCIKSVHSSTPLTLRDYNATPFGTLYGFQKDKNNPLQSYIHTKTSVKNLYLTGQSVNLHGVLGVTISALLTCFNFIDSKKLMNEIRAAK